MTNTEQLIEWLRTQPTGKTLFIATSQYAMNTVRDGFYFDFWSTAPCVRGLIKKGILKGESGFRYYEVIKIKDA